MTKITQWVKWESVNTDERSFPNPQSLNSCRTRDPNRCVTFPDQRSGFRPTQVLIIHLIILPLLKKRHGWAIRLPENTYFMNWWRKKKQPICCSATLKTVQINNGASSLFSDYLPSSSVSSTKWHLAPTSNSWPWSIVFPKPQNVCLGAKNNGMFVSGRQQGVGLPPTDPGPQHC